MHWSLERPAATGWPFCKTACRPLVARSSCLLVVPTATSRRSDVSGSGGGGSGGSTAGKSADGAACGGSGRRRQRLANGSVAGLSQDELDRVIHEVIEGEMHSALEQELETLNQVGRCVANTQEAAAVRLKHSIALHRLYPRCAGGAHRF